MRPVTQRFLDAVRGSHKMVARLTAVAPGQTGTSPAGIELPMISGDVKQDATAAIQGTLSATVLYDFASTPSGVLTPYGNEVYAERGIDYGDGSREWVGLGYYRLDNVSQARAPRGEIQISASDRMATIVDDRLVAPIEFSSGASFGSVFELLVHEVLPGQPVEYDFSSGTTTFSSAHIAEQDRYGFLKDMCDSIGKVMYFDYRGVLVVKTAPDPDTSVFTVNHGRGGVLVEMARSLTRQGVYNAVVASGEPAGELPPVRGVAVDSNPYSPTYWDGPFGRVPKFYSSSFLTTNTQCVNAARAMLDRSKGVPYKVDFTMVPNVALEVLDAVTVTYDDRADAEMHTLDVITYPLVPETTMPAQTRETLIGSPV